MEQNNQTKQNDLVDFSEFDLDTDLSADRTSSILETKQSTPIAGINPDAVVNNTNTLNTDDSSLLEFDIDESLLNQFSNPEPEASTTPHPTNHQSTQDIDKLFDDIPLNQPAQKSPMMQTQQSAVPQFADVDDNSPELEFDLQAELHDAPIQSPYNNPNNTPNNTPEPAMPDLNANIASDLDLTVNNNNNISSSSNISSDNPMFNNMDIDANTNPHNLDLGINTPINDQQSITNSMPSSRGEDNMLNNTSINQNVMPDVPNDELSLMVDEPMVTQNHPDLPQQAPNQFEQGMQVNPQMPPVPNMPNSPISSMGQAQPQHSQAQRQHHSDAAFNLPVNDNQNMGTHLGQSVGTIKARPPEDNPYAASNRMGSDDFGGYEEGNDSTWYNISGRIGRLRYLSYGFFIAFLMYIVLFFIGIMAGFIGAGEGLITFFAVIVAIPLSIVSGFIYPIRRLNDLGHTGWFSLLGLIPLVNIILYLYLTFAPGNDGFNEYGAPPRENQWYHWVGAIVVPIGFIAMIGILAAIAVPAYQDYIERAGAAASIESVE